LIKIERFEAVDRCLFWKEKKILVVGDLHLGYEEFLNSKGWCFPRTQMEETINIFSRIFAHTGKIKKIILLGDVKHYFSGILNKEFEDFYKLIEIFKENLLKNGKIIIVKGNHDNILEPIVCQEKYSNFVFLEDYYILQDVLFFHGNKKGFLRRGGEIADKKIKMIVTGHFHPAIKIDDGEKVEKFRCFVLGKYKKNPASHNILHNNTLWIVVPSFFPLEEGMDINSLGLKGAVFAVADKVYDFGKI